MTVLYSILYPRPEQNINLKIRQGSDAHIRQLDHVTTYIMIEQRLHEWGVKMSVATIDFMKAVWFHNPQLNLGRAKILWYRA